MLFFSPFFFGEPKWCGPIRGLQGFAGPGPLSGPDTFGSPAAAPNTLTISHRNEDTDLPQAFNYTLESQGLGKLV